MEVGTEISQKIRSAIKAKLMELGSYVDDELPDYIMVMVANKKSRTQMKNDLGLFLGANTDTFTGWLHGLIGKLQSIRGENDKQEKGEKSKGSKEKKKEKLQKSDSGKKDGKEKKKSGKRSSENSTKRKVSTAGNAEDISKHAGAGDVNDSFSENKNSADSVESAANNAKRIATASKNSQEEIEDVRQLLVTETPRDELAEELETTEIEVVNSKTVKDTAKLASSKKISADVSHSPNQDGHNIQTSNTARKRKVPTSVVANVSREAENEEEYDPYNPAVGSVASVVKVTSRKSSVPASLQANRVSSGEVSQEGEEVHEGESQAEAEEEPPNKKQRMSESVHLQDIKQALAEVLENSLLKNDDVAHFSRMVESALRKLSPHQQSLAKVRIQQVLCDFETSASANRNKSEDRQRSNQHNISAGNSTSIGAEGGESTSSLTQFNLSTTSKQSNNHAGGTSIQASTSATNIGDSVGGDNSEHILTSSLSSISSETKESPTTRIIFYPKSKSDVDSIKSLGANTSSKSELTVKSEERERRNSGRSQTGDQTPQSPVSSSKLDTGSPSSVHSCPPSSTSGLDVRKCIVSTSSKSRESTLSPTDPKSRQSALHMSRLTSSRDKPVPSIFVDSIHNRKRPETESNSVLKQSGPRDRSPRGAAPPSDVDEGLDSPRQISSEALKVMAKNLKITVINKRANKSHEGSTSTESSSEDTDDSASDDDEDDDDGDDQDEKTDEDFTQNTENNEETKEEETNSSLAS